MANKKLRPITSEVSEDEIRAILQSVGQWYGSYAEVDGEVVLDNGLEAFIYPNPREAAQDWIYSLLEDTSADWSGETAKLLRAGIKAEGVRSVPARDGTSVYMATIDYPTPSGKTRPLSAGTFDSPQEAYTMRLAAKELRTQCIAEGKDLSEFRAELRSEVKEHKISSQVDEMTMSM